MSGAPHITVKSPNAFISAEVRIGGWPEVRRLADVADCVLTEERTGWITKRFTIRGNEDQLNAFVQAAWDSDTMGLQFRTELRRAAHG